MDIGQLFTTAGNLIRHNPFLWLFGLLGVAATSLVNLGMRLWLRPELVSWLADPAAPLFSGPAGLIGFLIIVLAIALLIWLLNMVAEGGLIFAVSELDAGRTLTGRDIRQAIRRTLVPFVAADTLLFLPLFLLILLIVIGGTALFVAFVLGIERGNLDLQQGLTLLGGGLLACLLPLLCLAIPLLLATLLLRLFVFRAIAIDQAGVRESIRQAGQFVRHRPGPIILVFLLLWIIRLVINTITGLLTGPLELAALRPLLPILTGETPLPESSPAVMVGGIIVSLIGFLVGSLLFVLAGSVWTLLYQQGKET